MTDFDSNRRKLLKAGGAAFTIGLAGCIGPFEDTAGVPGTVERRDPDDGNGNGDDDWLADVPNWGGEPEDFTGEEEVEVLNGDGDEIGVSGTYVYEPADIQIDPGTTVEWTWVGGTSHSVTHEADDPDFDSETISGDGTTFDFTFDEEGIYDYYCIPHRGLEQKGRVRVGDGDGEADDGEADDGDIESQVEEYLADAPNWDGNIEDMTGEDDVTVLNGEPDEEGVFIYDPPAITVDAGTTVTWEWVGDNAHSVTHEEEEFDSETFDGDGETWEYTFDEAGLYLYYCLPHRALEQKGAVIVEE